jgi:hypothetical protein
METFLIAFVIFMLLNLVITLFLRAELHEKIEFFLYEIYRRLQDLRSKFRKKILREKNDV